MTFDKPIPVSPLIALDRERCILCYRCTRFSSDVAEDDQLIARNRGAHTEIATFSEDPYRAPFSGNVIELCPVGRADLDAVPLRGAAVGDPGRADRLRALPGRLQHPRDDARGSRQAGAVAEPPGDRRRLAVRQGPLRPPARARRRSRARAARPRHPRPRGADAGTRRSTAPRSSSAAPSGNVVTALSGSETTEIAYGLAALLRRGLGAHSAVMPESTSAALDAFRAPLSTIGEAELVVVVGDDEVVDRAPAVDLWLRKARRAGAEIVTIGARGATQAGPGAAAEALASLVSSRSALGKRLRESERAVLVWSGPGGGGGARLAEAAHALGFEAKPGCAAFHLPATPNARGVAEAWACAADEDEIEHESIGLLVVSGDEAASDPAVRDLAERAEAVIAITMFHSLAVGWADLVLPATAALEREGTSMNVEGRVQRFRRAVTPPVPDELAWLARLAERFDVDALAARLARLRRACGADLRWARARPAGRAGTAAARAAYGAAGATTGTVRFGDSPRGAVPRALRRDSAPAPLHAALLGAAGRARSRAAVPATGRRGRALGSGRRPARNRNGRHRLAPLERHLGRAARPRRPQARRGRRPDRRGARRRPPPRRRGREGVSFLAAGANGEPWWIAADQVRDRDQPRPLRLRVPHPRRAQGHGSHAAPVRAEPRRPVRAPAADRRPRQAHPQGELLSRGRDRRARTSSPRSWRRSRRSRRSR